ncbi:MAG: protein kinase [Pyrinomonadaceae bacterium]
MKALAQNSLIQNRYLVVHLIGKGGMGEVYLAVDQRLGSAVALKRTYFAGDEMLAAAFEREARTLARMRHPVLPKVSDHFGEGEEQYLVMEHISGDDLSKRLEAAQKPFPVSWVMFWADQLLDALSYLHSHEPPIIHRDIKPQNVKLTDENHIILLDFGLSKTSTGQTNISQSGSTGSVVGYTPHYAPMEQIRGIGTNARSDIYSLSATLYQLMTNVIPADALSRADTLLNGMSDPIEQPHVLNPEVPTAVSEVILKGMEVSQERRFNNAREMQKALRRAFTQMQEAMAAQTVAFNIEDVPADDPLSSAVEKTRLMPSEPLEGSPTNDQLRVSHGANNGEVDFDATLAFDPVENLEQAKQAGVRADLLPPSTDLNGKEAEIAAPIVPVSEAEDNVHDSFVTVAAGTGAAFADYRPEVDAAAEPGPAPEHKPAVNAPKKSSGRAFAIVGGLMAVLVLAAGAAAAGWYFYNNYRVANAVVDPTPSPQPTIEATPMPTPPVQAVIDTNSYTNSNSNSVTASGANSAVNQSVSETPTRVDAESPTSRPNPTAPNPSAPKPAASRPTASAPKAPPKPKTNTGRTDILQ